MKKLVIALALVTAASGAAFAKSSALDFQPVQPVNRAALDYTATQSINDGHTGPVEIRDRLGDGSPRYVGSPAIDFTPTASISSNDANQFEVRDRLGDGSPRFINN